MSDSWLNLSRTPDRFLLRPNWKTSPKSIFDDNRELIQFTGTVLDIYNLGDKIGRTITYGYTNVNREDEYYLVNFFCNHQGKLRRFWLPEWKNAFVLYENISAGDTTITIENCFFSLVDQGYERIFIELKNGDILSRSVSAVIASGYLEYIHLNNTIDRDISIDDIRYFGRLLLVRFDDDILNLSFRSDSVTKCSCTFKELPHEYGVEVES